MNYLRIFAFGLTISALIAACGKPPAAGKGAADPRDVLGHMADSLRTGNLADFRDCCGGPSGYDTIIEPAFHYLRAINAFKDSLEARWGPDGFEPFADLDLTQTVAMLEDTRDTSDVEHRPIRVTGHEAVLTDPIGDNKPSMRNIAGRWVIWLDDLGDPSRAAADFNRATQAIEQSRREVAAGSKDWKTMRARIYLATFGVPE